MWRRGPGACPGWGSGLFTGRGQTPGPYVGCIDPRDRPQKAKEVDMLLQDTYIGTGAPFEGNLTVWLRSLPAGAKVIKTTVQLISTPYTGTIDLTGQQPILGVTKVPGLSDPPASFVEVNLHARRTLVSVEGTSQIGATGDSGSPSLQVDMGGIYVNIADDGTILAPGKTAWTVPFPTVVLPASPSPSQSEPLPGLTVSKFRLSLLPTTHAATKSPLLYVTKVTISSVPTNVSVRVGQLPPFWTHLGELSTLDTSPDFAMVLNAFLATAQPLNGFYAIPFTIHSDTLAQVDIALQIEYVIDQPVLPLYLPEVTMTYAFNPLPDIDASLTTVKLPTGAVPVAAATNAQIRGEFQPTRVALKSEGTSSITANVVVSADSSLAQPFQSTTEIALTGIDLPLSKALPDLAGLNIAIQADYDGKPSGQVLIRADIVVGKPLPDQSSWGSATLPSPFRVLAGQVYWLVLESQVGQAAWQATPNTSSDLALQASRDGGLSWRPANAPEALAPLSAQFRLRNIPASFTIPVQLDIGTKPRDVIRTLDEFAPLGRVELTFGFADKLAEHLTIVAAASPCGNADLVVNGDFSAPPPDDANMKLFGIDNKPGGAAFTSIVKLGPQVNLSVERFITVSFLATVLTPARRIDCAGFNPAQTTPEEIVIAINHAMRQPVATFQHGNLTLADIVILYPWCKNELPSGWQGTPAQTYRFRLKMSDKITHTVAMLTNFASQADSLFVNDRNIAPACFQRSTSISNNAEASLSQRLSVTAGCTYQLSILFQLLPFERSGSGTDPSPASWTASWLDTNGNVLHIDSETFDTGSITVEALLLAPPNATNVDLRFINSSPNTHALILGSVSFTPTQQALRNGRFQQVTSSLQVPAGWTLESGLLDIEQMAIRLSGDSSDDTILSQVVDVIAGDMYELCVSARLETPLQSDPASLPLHQRARLELQWQSNGQPGDVIALTLDGQTFSENAWAGTVPVGITQASVRLVQPKSSAIPSESLLVTAVTLAHIELISVPLTFLSDAPGQLTVSKMHVVYDLPASTTVSPAKGTATIVSARGKEMPTTPTIVSSSGASNASRTVPSTAPSTINGPATPPSPAIATAQPQTMAITTESLTTVPGIGEARAFQLQSIGIDSLAKLAAASPDDIVQTLKGVKSELAARFITEAQQIISAQQNNVSQETEPGNTIQ